MDIKSIFTEWLKYALDDPELIAELSSEDPEQDEQDI